MATESKLDPTSLVARIIAELQANPDAQRLLLRALLTNEFLGVPARLDRIEKDIVELKADVSQLKTDVSQLKTDVSQLKTDVSQLKTDVAQLKGSDLENRLHRRIRALASQALGLRRSRVVQSPVQETTEGFADSVEEALESGRITAVQETRIEATDFIMRAQRRSDKAPVWIAVEASNRVDAGDIERGAGDGGRATSRIRRGRNGGGRGLRHRPARCGTRQWCRGQLSGGVAAAPALIPPGVDGAGTGRWDGCWLIGNIVLKLATESPS